MGFIQYDVFNCREGEKSNNYTTFNKLGNRTIGLLEISLKEIYVNGCTTFQ